MNAKSAFSLVKSTAKEFNEDNVLRLSAALSYYAIFSIGPLLAIVVGVAGLAFGNEGVRQHIHQSLQGMLGENSAKTIDSMMAARSQGTSLVTTIVGVVALLFGAAGVFGQLQDSLNTIWEVKSKPGAGIWELLRKRFLSFSMVLGVGFLLLVSLALSTALGAFTGYIGRMIPMGEVLGHLFDITVSFAVVTVLFAMIFKFLPDIIIPWRKVWMGAIVTSLLFTLGKYLLGLYLGRQSTASAYGAAGSVIIILMWVYYASLILFFGAEFTQVYAKRTGTKVVPSKHAVPVTDEERAQQGLTREEKDQASARPQEQGSYAGAFRSSALPASAQPAPGTVLRNKTPDMFWMLFATGIAAAALLKFKPLRTALKLYSRLQ
jgi:membrane protein